MNRKSKCYKYDVLKDRFTQSSTTHSNSKAFQKERSNGELSTTRLSVKSMVMRPTYVPGITCWSFKTWVVYVWLVAYISRRNIFPHVQLQSFMASGLRCFLKQHIPLYVNDHCGTQTTGLYDGQMPTYRGCNRTGHLLQQIPHQARRKTTPCVHNYEGWKGVTGKSKQFQDVVR